MSDVTTKHLAKPYVEDLVVALRTIADVLDKTDDLQLITRQLDQLMIAVIQMVRALDDEVRR